ncbi:MAG: hypothetical protein IJ622_10285 [Bacteroidales bacterium]|nr:hypothetical protein [Bacteroidales bacterium]
METKRIITTAFTLLAFIATFAQSSDDACLFSQAYYQGTAKAMGMGNAMGAVGGDMTATCINPAGMGIYRSNEFTTTLNLLDNYNSSTYYGTQNSANTIRMSIPNVGYVSSRQRSNYRRLRFTQFGIGLTRTNDYNIHSYARGVNPTSSKIDSYLNTINDLGLTPLEISDFAYDLHPAWLTYLIDQYNDGQGTYYSSPVPQGNIWQGMETRFKGRSEEWTFAGSANFSERLFIGGSIGLAHVKRFGTSVFEESRLEGTDAEFDEWTYTQDISSTGWGINAKAGLIFVASPWLRLGAAFHSPTFMAFDETWQTETESQIQNTIYKRLSPNSSYEYNLVRPLKWIGSVAFLIGDSGLVSFDAEYTNFGATRIMAVANDDYDYSPVNDDIENIYDKTFNFRLGGEWRLGSSYLRLGAAYYGSPFGIKEDVGSVKKGSIGISLPVSLSTTFDFAYELAYGQTLYFLYDPGDLGIEAVDQKQFKNNLAATLKVRF